MPLRPTTYTRVYDLCGWPRPKKGIKEDEDQVFRGRQTSLRLGLGVLSSAKGDVSHRLVLPDSVL